MKNLKIMILTSVLLSSQVFACTMDDATNVAQTDLLQMAREYNSSKAGLTGLSALNGIASANFIIFQPVINGVQGASDLIGNIVIDLNTCRQIEASSGTFNILNVN